MEKKVPAFFKELFQKREFRRFEEGEAVDQFIIDKSAKVEIDQLTESVTSSLRGQLLPLLERILSPSLEVKHIREQGLRIWGKKENVAMSELSIIEILNNLFNSCDKEKFISGLFMAGRKSALNFFDQFRDILLIDNTQHIPNSVFDFLYLLGEFDTRSAWWEKITYIEDNGYLTISIMKPFLRFPWFETHNHSYMTFISGYLLTLHNCCYDYLNLISKINKWEFNDKIGVSIKIFEDPSPTKSNLKLLRAHTSIEEFQEIDVTIYLILEMLSSDENIEENRDTVFLQFEELKGKIEELFGEKLNIDYDELKTLKENNVRNSPEYIRNILYPLLNDVRLQYEDKRISKLVSIP